MSFHGGVRGCSMRATVVTAGRDPALPAVRDHGLVQVIAVGTALVLLFQLPRKPNVVVVFAGTVPL